MSAYIKREIGSVKYIVCCFEEECDFLHSEVHVLHHEHGLLEYEFMLKELDKAYYGLERLEKKHKLELGKGSVRRENDEGLGR